MWGLFPFTRSNGFIKYLYSDFLLYITSLTITIDMNYSRSEITQQEVLPDPTVRSQLVLGRVSEQDWMWAWPQIERSNFQKKEWDKLILAPLILFIPLNEMGIMLSHEGNRQDTRTHTTYICVCICTYIYIYRIDYNIYVTYI